jgi:hypothetical protein
MPIFVLSKKHFQTGIAFPGIGARWFYSEICKFSKVAPFGSFNPDDNDDIVYLLRFSQFYIECAVYHRASIGKNIDPTSLVDKAGSRLNIQNLRVIGQRVFRGADSEGNEKVLKLISNHDCAAKELNTRRAIAKVLNYDELQVSLIEGCGSPESDTMCAIMDQYISESLHVTYDHLINLVEQVDILYKNEWVHGDLRIPNIRFLPSGRVSLIDFEWAGKVGEAKFPDNINASAFHQCAKDMIRPGNIIPKHFDWCCVAGFLDVLGCSDAAVAAIGLQKLLVVNELESCRERGVQLKSPLGAGAGAITFPLDLSRLGGRLREFYSRKIEIGDRSRCIKRRYAKKEIPSRGGGDLDRLRCARPAAAAAPAAAGDSDDGGWDRSNG